MPKAAKTLQIGHICSGNAAEKLKSESGGKGEKAEKRE